MAGPHATVLINRALGIEGLAEPLGLVVFAWLVLKYTSYLVSSKINNLV